MDITIRLFPMNFPLNNNSFSNETSIDEISQWKYLLFLQDYTIMNPLRIERIGVFYIKLNLLINVDGYVDINHYRSEAK